MLCELVREQILCWEHELGIPQVKEVEVKVQGSVVPQISTLNPFLVTVYQHGP